MATIHREAILQAPAETVWQKLRDVGNAASVFPGVLTASRLANGSRVVTFANGMEVTELIVEIDDDRRRLVYAAQENGFLHHNASMQVIPESDGSSRFIWISDFLPDDLSPQVTPLIDAGVASFAGLWNVGQD